MKVQRFKTIDTLYAVTFYPSETSRSDKKPYELYDFLHWLNEKDYFFLLRKPKIYTSSAETYFKWLLKDGHIIRRSLRDESISQEVKEHLKNQIDIDVPNLDSGTYSILSVTFIIEPIRKVVLGYTFNTPLDEIKDKGYAETSAYTYKIMDTQEFMRKMDGMPDGSIYKADEYPEINFNKYIGDAI